MVIHLPDLGTDVLAGPSPNGDVVAEPTGPDLLAVFGELVDTRTGCIGRVVGSEKEPAGAHRFYIWADDGALSLDVGHVVVAFAE